MLGNPSDRAKRIWLAIEQPAPPTVMVDLITLLQSVWPMLVERDAAASLSRKRQRMLPPRASDASRQKMRINLHLAADLL